VPRAEFPNIMLHSFKGSRSERLGLEAIILHEQANRGRTVIEKVIEYGNVGFAVVLHTPDDEGCVKGGTLEPRARQNVLLELGFFIGHLGRDKVCALKKRAVEIPSDFVSIPALVPRTF